MGIFDIFRKKKDKEKVELDNFVETSSEGVSEELSKVKKGEKNLVSDEHLRALSLTSSVWLFLMEKNENEKPLPSKYIHRFCRLFLEEEKKRKKIKDFCDKDLMILNILTNSVPIDIVMEMLNNPESVWNYENAKIFEKAIGYNKAD